MGVIFDKPSAKRIARTVRIAEREPTVLSRPPRRGRWPNQGGASTGLVQASKITVYNDFHTVIPQGGVFLYEWSEAYAGYDYVPQDYAANTRALAGARTQIAIAVNEIAQNSAGPCVIDGVADALMVPYTRYERFSQGVMEPSYLVRTVAGDYYDIGDPMAQPVTGSCSSCDQGYTGHEWDFHLSPFTCGPLLCLAVLGYPYARVAFRRRRV